MIPEHPNVRLTRRKTANALTEAGFPVKEGTLATKATRGGGPPYERFGTRALYRWADALQWAEARLSAPRRSTSEGEALDLQRADHQRVAGGSAAFDNQISVNRAVPPTPQRRRSRRSKVATPEGAPS